WRRKPTRTSAARCCGRSRAWAATWTSSCRRRSSRCCAPASRSAANSPPPSKGTCNPSPIYRFAPTPPHPHAPTPHPLPPKPQPLALDQLLRRLALALHAKDQPPKTLAEWEKRRAALRQSLLSAMGPFPENPCPLNAQVLGTLKRPGYRI